jgi:creatinine amidohydrolase
LNIEDCNWFQVEEYLARDDRLVIPLGSVEQHAYLSLGVDRILSERVAVEAAEPTGVLVMPSLPYGLTPYFAAYPGSPTLRVETYRELLADLVDSLAGQGFRRFLFVNGHGGNDPGFDGVKDRGDVETLWHNWWAGTRVRETVDSIDPDATHASWFENFPWTRLEGVELPQERKPPLDQDAYRVAAGPAGVRELLGDGVFEGAYELPDEQVRRVWEAGVAELRDLLENAWR